MRVSKSNLFVPEFVAKSRFVGWAIKLAGGSRPHQLSDLNEPSAFCTRLKTRLK